MPSKRRVTTRPGVARDAPSAIQEPNTMATATAAILRRRPGTSAGARAISESTIARPPPSAGSSIRNHATRIATAGSVYTAAIRALRMRRLRHRPPPEHCGEVVPLADDGHRDARSLEPEEAGLRQVGAVDVDKRDVPVSHPAL